jgi:dATP pyrophosphohydrolase
MTSYKRPESVLVVIATDADEVLLLERRDWPGFWQSITGSLESSETPVQTAQREVFEEIGLLVPQDALIDCKQAAWYTIYPAFRHRYAPEVTQNLEHCFRLRLPERCVVQISDEHTGYQWLPAAEAHTVAKTSTNQEAIMLWLLNGREN